MGLEEARAAISQTYGAGPVNPDKLSSDGIAPKPESSTQAITTESKEFTGDQASKQSADGTEQPQMTDSETQKQIEEMLDLASFNKKIKIGEDVYTPEELKKSVLRWSDYTKKTQALAEEKKQAKLIEQYAENFQYDLEKVLQDPERWESAFRKTYPKSYQAVYDKIKEKMEGGQSQAEDLQNQSQYDDPRTAKLLKVIESMDSRLSRYEQMSQEAQLRQAEATLDKTLTKLQSKYDLGSEKANAKLEKLVLARAQVLDNDPTAEDFEELYKEEYEEMLSLVKDHGEKQFRAQKQANAQAKDTAKGGGTPSAAPVTPKTLREARDAMEAHLRMKS